MKIKTWQKVTLTIISIFSVSALVFTTATFAVHDSGSGSTGGQATTTTCNTATHVKNTQQCSDNYGGASWHIFSVYNPPVLNNNLDKVQPSSLRPTYNTNEKFMKDGGYDWAFSCPADRYDYYLAYVYDGWNGLNMTNGPVWYGPLQWQVACGEINGHCNHPVYHTRNANSYAAGIESIKNGTANTLRINGSHPTSKVDDSYVSADALAFYRKYCSIKVNGENRCDPNAANIPEIGYFCIPKTIYYSPYAKQSTIDIKINGSDGPIYVKPGDDVTFKTNYNPEAQAGYNVESQNINVDEEGIKPGGYTQFATLGTLFSWYSGRGNWGNSFTVSGNILSRTLSYSGTVGSTASFNDGDGNSYKIKSADVGENSPNETAALTRNTPGYVYSRSYYDAYVLADIDTRISDSAKAAVPYNFINSTEVTTDESEIVYAGETKKFDYTVTTSPKQNNTTGGYYATIVRDVKVALQLCYLGTCRDTISDPTLIGDLHKETSDQAETYNSTEHSSGITINIPDVAAGTRVCLKSAVYPANSGSEKNLDKKGSDTWTSWNDTTEKCYVVAKKPTLQAWGGNVYSQANLRTSNIAVKNNLAGSEYSYEIVVGKEKAKHTFGSWGELGVITNGSSRYFGSGASMGYPLGNSEGTDFCKLIPLTVPNDSCGNSGTTSTSSSNQASNDKSSIIELLGGENDIGDTITQDLITSKAGGVANGITKVITHNGDITIDSNLEYLTESYQKYSEIPKLAIYAKGGNIYINCDVDRIDALLIADKTVVTCKNFGDNNELTIDNIEEHINDPKNSQQLTINGAIIAKMLIANRTYGAATGENSIIPAEIINFDPTLYQFGNAIESDDDTGGRLDTVYMREAPPRL